LLLIGCALSSGLADFSQKCFAEYRKNTLELQADAFPASVFNLYSYVFSAIVLVAVLLFMKKDKKIIRKIRLLSIGSLVLTMVVFILNLAAYNMSSVWGNVLDIIYRIISTPMYCCQLKLLGLFGWACLMSASFFVKE
jgi:hypothetical protein